MTLETPNEPMRFARFSGVVLLVFALQVLLIFWLSNGRSPKPAPHPPQAGLVLDNEDPHQVLRYFDQSLFALPHVESFSGTVWIQSQPLKYKAFDWTEPERWLPIRFRPVEDVLGDLLPGTARPQPAIRRPEPELAVPGMLNVGFLPEGSRLRVLSGAAEFNAVNTVELPSWPAVDLISNSIVQVVARPDGTMLSAALLARSGSSGADEHALNLARKLRIAPAEKSVLRWGSLSFEWHTIVPQTPQPQDKAQ